MSVEPPSALFGKIEMSTRPFVAARIASQASAARLLIGCAAGRSLPYFSLNSPACARARRLTMPAPASAPAPARIVRLEIFPMTFLPRFICIFCLPPTLVGLHRGGKLLGNHESGQVGVRA